MRIIIVENDGKFASALDLALKAERYVVERARSIATCLDHLRTYHHDLMILSLNRPEGGRITLIKQVRDWGLALPILVLADESGLDEKIDAFEAGADDYVVKPIEITEIIIRVHALLRRGPVLSENVLHFGDLEINRLKQEVHRGGKSIALNAKEFSILEYLVLNCDRVLSRDTILDKLWDHAFSGPTNIVDVYIGNLRRKIDRGSEGSVIRTVRGVGYSISGDIAGRGQATKRYA